VFDDLKYLRLKVRKKLRRIQYLDRVLCFSCLFVISIFLQMIFSTSILSKKQSLSRYQTGSVSGFFERLTIGKQKNKIKKKSNKLDFCMPSV